MVLISAVRILRLPAKGRESLLAVCPLWWNSTELVWTLMRLGRAADATPPTQTGYCSVGFWKISQ